MPRTIERLWHRLRALLRRRREDASLAGEIALHLEEATREYVARGLSPAEARLAARRDFGPVALVEDQCRDTRRVAFLQSLGQDLRYGLRSLLAQPVLAVAAIASIGAGAGATAVVVTLAFELLLAAPTARAPHELVNIRLDGNSHVSYADWRALDESEVLAGLAGYHIEGTVNLLDGDRTVSIVPLVATANFFDVVGVPMALGRGFTATEAAAERDPRLAVVSDGFWRVRLGSDPRAVGRSLVVNGQTYTVLGVLPPRLRSITGFGLAPEIYLPISRALMPDIDHPQAAAAQLVGRLRPRQSFEAGRAAFDTVVRRRHAADAARPRRLGTFARVTDGIAGLPTIAAFFGTLALVGGLVLSIACANVAGLLLARNTVRSKELALRASLGASRWRLAQQLLVEAGWLAALGTACGIGFMLLVMATIAALPLPLPLPLEIHAPIDWRLFGLMLGMVVTTTLVSGVLPALQGARAALSPALKQETRTYVHRRWTLRGLLVIGQVAISVALVVIALLFLRNLLLAGGLDAGFDTRRTLVAQVGLIEGQYTPDRRVALLGAAAERLGRLPGAERAAFAYGMPLTIRHGQTNQMKIAIDGGGRPFLARWAQNAVGDGYFATLGIPVTRGREFTASDAPGTPRVAIVNEAFVHQYLGGRSPVGRRLHIPDAGPEGDAEIVGVTGNIRHRSIGEAQMAAIYWAYRQRPGDARVAHVVVRSAGDPAALRRPIAQAIGALEPTAATDVQTVSQSLAFAFLPSRVGAALLGGLGLIGLTLAMAGLFALVSYSVSRRTREIGVRTALGAPRRAVVRLVVADAVVLVATGVVVGLGLAALATPPLALFLVAGLSPSDPIAFAGAAVLFMAISAVATLPPIRRAIGVGPLVALRTD